MREHPTFRPSGLPSPDLHTQPGISPISLGLGPALQLWRAVVGGKSLGPGGHCTPCDPDSPGPFPCCPSSNLHFSSAPSKHPSILTPNPGGEPHLPFSTRSPSASPHCTCRYPASRTFLVLLLFHPLPLGLAPVPLGTLLPFLWASNLSLSLAPSPHLETRLAPDQNPQLPLDLLWTHSSICLCLPAPSFPHRHRLHSSPLHSVSAQLGPGQGPHCPLIWSGKPSPHLLLF